MAKNKAGKTKSNRSGTKTSRANFAERTTNGDLLSKSRRAIGDAYDWAQQKGQHLPRAGDLYLPDQRAIRNMVEERPLMLGAIGLGIGMVIGAVLPSYGSPRARRAPAGGRNGHVGSRH
jgi:ElaB/YqjD/DUF883 family membrane-anchored ribosome-binding protein